MPWVKRINSKSQINKAGKTIVNPHASQEERGTALAIVNNWRSAHSFPLNTIQNGLRARALKVDPEATIAQRIKRLPSIEKKLDRFPNMDLARMQDLGGCRAVLMGMPEVEQVVSSFLQSRHRHRLLKHDDYISAPKPSGYRSVHLTYAYESDRNPDWNGLVVEVQIRTRLQHAWATTVETASLFTNQALKASQGDDRWLRFFAIAGSIFAIIEGRPTVPGTPTGHGHLRDELSDLVEELNVLDRLRTYSSTVQAFEPVITRKDYVLLTLDLSTGVTNVHPFKDLGPAADAYAIMEGAASDNLDVVLVQIDSFAALRSAYPNYFLDTSLFIDALESALGSD